MLIAELETGFFSPWVHFAETVGAFLVASILGLGVLVSGEDETLVEGESRVVDTFGALRRGAEKCERRDFEDWIAGLGAAAGLVVGLFNVTTRRSRSS